MFQRGQRNGSTYLKHPDPSLALPKCDSEGASFCTSHILILTVQVLHRLTCTHLTQDNYLKFKKTTGLIYSAFCKFSGSYISIPPYCFILSLNAILNALGTWQVSESSRSMNQEKFTIQKKKSLIKIKYIFGSSNIPQPIEGEECSLTAYHKTPRKCIRWSKCDISYEFVGFEKTRKPRF